MAVKRDIRKELEERSFKEMLQYVKKTIEFLFKCNKKKFVLIVFLEMFNVLIPIGALLLLQEIINSAINGVFYFEFITLFVILSIVQVVLNYFLRKLNENYQIDIRIKSEKQLYSKKTELRIEDFDNKKLHNSSNRADRASANFMWLFRRGKGVVFDSVRVVSYMVILIAWKLWLLPIIFIVPFINVIITSKVLKENFIKRWELAELRRKNNYYGWLMYKFESLKEIKVLNINNIVFKKFSRSVDELQGENRKLENSYIDQTSKVSFIDSLFQTGYFIYLVSLVVVKALQIGNFNTYRTAFSSISRYTNSITKNLLQVNIELLELKEYFDFIEYENNYIDGTKKLKKITTIEFKKVSFKYKNTKEDALKNVSFKINAGQKVAFIGENGSGKTTVMNLIMKIYKPSSGRILINGIDVTEYTTESIRDRISMLMQEFTMFEESVLENITLSDGKAKAREVYKKIPFPELSKIIKGYKKGINTIMGTWFGEGINMSKGQTQKLVLSRIFYKDSDCYILDEPNSALDPRSEKHLFEYIRDKMNGKTCILTLHVFTNIDIMDKIIMFEEGKIICEGAHEELYKTSEDYKEFYNLQERSLDELAEESKK